MDRIALSKRIGGLADVFATGSPIRRELEAMSYALEHMADEKFASILNAGYEADKESADIPFRTQPAGLTSIQERIRGRQQSGYAGLPGRDIAYLDKLMDDNPEAVMGYLKKKMGPLAEQLARKPAGTPSQTLEASEKVSGNSWNREASEAVIRNLICDVLGKEAMEKAICCDTGRHLDKKQMPDATKKQEKPATLTDPQTPKLSESLDSDMYSKSKGAVRKEAGQDPVEEMTEGQEPPAEEKPKAKKAPKTPVEEEPPVKAEPKAKQVSRERKEQQAEETKEEATTKAEETADALKKLEKMTPKTASDESEGMVSFDGIEFGSPMMEVELTDEDRKTLGKLFG